MHRITKKDVSLAFQRFLDATGRRAATAWNDVGGLQLDYNPTYGGYDLQEIMSKSGGITHPFGSLRHSGSEMYHMLHFAARVAESMRRPPEPFIGSVAPDAS